MTIGCTEPHTGPYRIRKPAVKQLSSDTSFFLVLLYSILKNFDRNGSLLQRVDSVVNVAWV